MKERERFLGLSGGRAKRLGRVELRSDWEEVKIEVMREVLRCKFSQNPDLKAKLIATGDAELIEGNNWNDRFWGVCRGVGQNHLGRLLMELRAVGGLTRNVSRNAGLEFQTLALLSFHQSKELMKYSLVGLVITTMSLIPSSQVSAAGMIRVFLRDSFQDCVACAMTMKKASAPLAR